MKHPRSLLVGCLTLALATVMAAQPVAAFNETRNTGKTAEYTVNDSLTQPGVGCRYEGALQTLDRIVIRKLWTHGPYARKSWVGFQYLIQRDSPPTGDGFRTFFKSPIVKKRADQAEVAYFSRRFEVPSAARGWFRVKLIIRYYKQGTSTVEVGRVAGTLEVYEHVASDGAPSYTIGDEGDAGYCRKRFD
jgi:hypothetical protein